MAKRLVIVESPTKARTIEKFLGKDFEVKASYGHIRDLPNNASEIPVEVKKEAWARIGVNVDKDFEPLYIIPDKKKKQVQELKAAMKGADEILLATDEDREGESISWHLLEVLKPKVPVKRLVFHEITKDAIQHALNSARDIDQNLVHAQETRRVIDRLFGYSISPLLWKKMAPRLSAGRVQSVALKLLVERERERISFKPATFWDLKARFCKKGPESKENEFEGELTLLGEARIASGKDFDPKTGKLLPDSKVRHLSESEANALKERLEGHDSVVSSVEEKPFTSKAPPPFTTSTLQQEASSKLGFAARRTMSVAQTLYENGFITYMRTDSTSLSTEAIEGARTLIAREFGKEYLPDAPRVYKTKVKNAQEAHEAIRPAGSEFVHPTQVRDRLGMEAFKLYELIFQRMLACQMMEARGVRVVVQLKNGDATFRSSGKTILFPGFLRAYVEGAADPDAELAEQDKILPKLTQGEAVNSVGFDALSHTTQPPARYTEGTLIRELERLGIGRPSTWATIVDVVLSRTYAFKKGTALVPTFLATAVIGLMSKYFTNLVDYEFTARMEDDLDAISRGEINGHQYLKKFYFGNGHPGLKTLVTQGEETIDPRIVCGLPIGEDETGRVVEVRIGRFGPFLSNGENRASLLETLPPDELNIAGALKLLADAARGPEALGIDPTTQEPIYLKVGRFGPYVQRGVMEEGKEKPKMASLLPGMQPADITFDIAQQLLQFPRLLGTHPETNQEVFAATGRYGPYIKSAAETRTIPLDTLSPLTITLNDALELLKQPRTRGRGSQPKVMHEVGKHPVSEKVMQIKSGRYGPYVTDGETNASLPQGADPAAITIEEAAILIDARAARVAEGGGRKAKKKAPAKKAAAKKTKPKAEAKEKKPKSEKEKKPKKVAAPRKKKTAAADAA
jgi:DNA topoisomerase-1